MSAEPAGRPERRWRDLADYVRSLGLDAYLVGGAVRDELLRRTSPDQDFLVPGVGHAELRAALAPHGRLDELEVAGQLVGVRLFPRDRHARALAPAGIEFTPPRAERSTGPGRHDFAIVADPSITLEQDMERRDFTVNAMARRLSTGELVDPFGGAEDLRRGVLRTVTPNSFRDDPLRTIRGLRLVSELGLEPDDGTRAQMREHARAVRRVSGERIGGGIKADGMGELSKLLLGAEPAKALRLARDTGVLVAFLPEFEPARAYDQESRYHDLRLDEHIFRAVQAGADAGANLPVRLALLLHDLGKPAAAWRGKDNRLHFYANADVGKRSHEAIGGDLAAAALARLRYPSRLRAHVVRIVRNHMFSVGYGGNELKARKFLARHGDELAFDLVSHRQADLRGKRVEVDPKLDRELRELDRFRATLRRERRNPYRVAHLAVDGADLIAVGFQPGPGLGQALNTLLADVVVDPSLNTREWLTARAQQLLADAA